MAVVSPSWIACTEASWCRAISLIRKARSLPCHNRGLSAGLAGWLEKSLDNVREFKYRGYNIIHIVANAGLWNEVFNFTKLDMLLDECDKMGFWIMYDMRWIYMNLSSVEGQVNILKARKSLLRWYTGEDPDGETHWMRPRELMTWLNPWTHGIRFRFV